MKLAVAAAVALATFFVLAYALLALPALPDTDSWYHLAVARLFAEEGFVDALPWPRFSVMHEHFGDKELLFHILLMPFARGDAATNGRLAIALFNALIAGLITLLAWDGLGRWAALAAPLLYLTAPYFWSRTIRLRPELLALLLLLAIVAAARRNRLWLVALLSAAFALGYTAFHVLAGFAGLWLLVTRQWRAPAAVLGGLTVGLLVHPHFPHNLSIWWLQNVRFLFETRTLDVGAEIHPPSLLLLVLHNAGWWLAMIATVLFLRPARPSAWTGVPAVVFTVLQLAMERMSTYFFPFVTLAVTEKPAGPLERRRGVALGLTLVVAVAVSAPFTLASIRATMSRLPADVERDYAELAKRIPPGAKVAARWGATDAYVFFAPQGRYLNVLDPLFMAEPHPEQYAAQRRLFDGTEADIPAVARSLDSDYVAFARWEAPPLFLARTRADPRLQRLYDGYNVLLRVVPSDAFLDDWQTSGGKRLRTELVRGSSRCDAYVHRLSTPAASMLRLEFAPEESGRVFIDGLPRAAAGATAAILGKGVLFDTPLAAGPHEVRVEACGAFYVLKR